LAADIASIDPAFISAYKRLIDDGFALPFGEALALEHERSSPPTPTMGGPAEMAEMASDALPIDEPSSFPP
jgi:enoyl-CoA hydratase